jgi:hypothetical protein
MGSRQRGRTELSDTDVDHITAAVQRRYSDHDIDVAVVRVDALVARGANLIPSQWIEPTVNPQELLERIAQRSHSLQIATRSLASGKPTPNVVAAQESPVPSTTLRAMADRGLITIIRPRRFSTGKITKGGNIPLIRPKGIVGDFTVKAREAVDYEHLPHHVELTRRGDILVLTDGRVRTGIDHTGGAAVSGSIQIVRPQSPSISPTVLAALITHRGQQYASGAAAPKIDLNSLEIPQLDADSTRRLEAALRKLHTHRGHATATLAALDDLSEVLLVGVTTGSLRVDDEGRTDRP